MVRHFDGSAEMKIRYDLFRAFEMLSNAMSKAHCRCDEVTWAGLNQSARRPSVRLKLPAGEKELEIISIGE